LRATHSTYVAQSDLSMIKVVEKDPKEEERKKTKTRIVEF